MEVSFNNDTFFFNIECAQLKNDTSVNKLISEDVIEFSLTEEMGKLVSGSLSIHDELGAY